MGWLSKLRGWRTVIINTLAGLPAAFYAIYLQLATSNIDLTPVIPQKYVAWAVAGWAVLGVILRISNHWTYRWTTQGRPTVMWLSIISFLGGPVVSGLIKAYQAKLAAGNTSEKIASDLAAHEIAAQTMETQSITQYRIAELGYWYEPDKLMGYTVAFLFAKVVIWDICLGLGTTDLHQGFVTTTSAIIISFYFGKRGFENIASILKRK